MNKIKYEEIIYKSKYSRWDDKLKRRENWDETIDRYKNFMLKNVLEKRLGKDISENILNDFNMAIDFIKEKNVVPSMRALWSSGKALEQSHIASYNCAYIVVDSFKSFAETMYILMHGTGVGFSVESQYVNKMPSINSEMNETDDVIEFKDSRLGWAKGYYHYIQHLVDGQIPKYDVSRIRPAGTKLKTFGGFASGSQVLVDLLEYTKKKFITAKGRKLTTLECHDIMCKVAEAVVSGGTRRSALISLSNLHDIDIRDCKSGEFWILNPERTNANNSAVYETKPSLTKFNEEFMSLIKSKTGERGIVNREALVKNKPDRRNSSTFGVNPCGEVSLIPCEFCNLTEVAIRENDDLDVLLEKVKYATILGILQSCLTDFKFISSKWKKNCEEERLLGVSLTGLMDNPVLNSVSDKSKEYLTAMKKRSIEVAEEWSKYLDINMPASITTCKPSGTTSQVLNTSSGIHARFSKYYIRRVRFAKHDPICSLLIDAGVKWNPEVGQLKDNCTTVVFDFPIKSPESSKIVSEMDAIEQLEYWKMLKEYWAEHNVSATIYVKENEWFKVMDWVYSNWDIVAGLSFLPLSDNVYKLAPYEEISKEEYENMVKEFPEIDLALLTNYEQDDKTTGAKEFACVGGACELI